MTTAASNEGRTASAPAPHRRDIRAAVLAAVLASLACGGGDGSSEPPPAEPTRPPIFTAQGTPTGDAATGSIGAEGGTLSSEDGRLTVTVPAGAVAEQTEFSVQRITNAALGGVGGAFRLRPEGLSFRAPVTLVFQGPETYAPGTGIEGLGIAFQDASGFWFPVRGVRRDAGANTLTADVTHFSDWGVVWQDGVPGLYGTFTLSQTIGAVPFDASGTATLFYQGDNETKTLYILTGTATPTQITPPAGTCSPTVDPPVQTLAPSVAEIWTSPAQFRWSINAAWELTCSAEPVDQLMAAVFDTVGISMSTAGCTRGYVGTAVIGTSGTQGTYLIDCGTSGSATATWEFVACVPGVACTDPALNPCVGQATSCDTGVPVCTETGVPLADGTSCGTDLYCSAGACAALTSIAVTPPDPTVVHPGTQPFTATGTYSDGSTHDLTAQVVWASSNIGAATIDALGTASTVAAGTTSISATLGGVSGSTLLTVTKTLTSIAVTPANPSVAAGLAQQFVATGSYSDGSTEDLTATVTWASSNTAAATIAAGGLAMTTAEGTTTISATSAGVSGSTTLTVTAPALTSIEVAPANPSVAAGLTQPFTATGTYTDGSTQDLTAAVIWASSNTAAATIASGGLATTLAAGATTISATLGSVSGSTTLTVLAASLTSINVAPANPSVAAGLTQQFTATGTYTDGSTQDLTAAVTWTSSNTAAATIAPGGLATTLAVGTTTISAASGNIGGSATLTVTTAELTSIAVNPVNPSVAAGVSQQFTATGTYTDGSTQDLTAAVTWASSNTAAATIAPGGLATTLAAGTTTISATSGTVNGGTTLTVLSAALTSIAVTPVNPSVAAGLSQQFIATGTYSDGSSQDLTSQVFWASSNTAAATIAAGGLATTAAEGLTNITATSGTVSGGTTLTVTAPALTSIAVTPGDSSVLAGGTVQFTAMGTYTDGATQDLTGQASWTSSNTAAATIASGGLASAVAAGSTIISATSGAVSGTTTLNVLPPLLTSIAVTPASPSIETGGTLQFTATGTYSDGSAQDLTSQVAWAPTSDPVATIDATGLATGWAAGSTTILATLDGVVGDTTLTVLSPTLLSVAVTPANQTIPAGTTLQFTATGTYSNGSTGDLTTQVTWTSSDTTAATIAAGGLATAGGGGTTTITATVSGVSGNTTLIVTPVLTSVVVTPADAVLTLGVDTQQLYTATGNWSDGSSGDLAGQVTWTSSNEATATIDPASGLATVVAEGTTSITATHVGGAIGSTSLRVQAPPQG